MKQLIVGIIVGLALIVVLGVNDANQHNDYSEVNLVDFNNFLVSGAENCLILDTNDYHIGEVKECYFLSIIVPDVNSFLQVVRPNYICKEWSFLHIEIGDKIVDVNEEELLRLLGFIEE